MKKTLLLAISVFLSISPRLSASCSSMLLTPFQQRTETAAGGNVHGLQLVDYDNDGILDLVGLIDASASGGSAALYSWHGLADGTFDTPVSLGLTQVADLVVADVNNDGKKDLVMSTWDDKLVVMLGNGSGFDTAKTKTLDHYETHISAVSFDGDAYIDVVGAAEPYNFFVVYHGNGDGTFTEIKRVSTGSIGPYAITAADFDGDGRTDVAYSDFTYTGTVLIAFQNADGTFAAPVTLQSGKATAPGTLRDFPSTLTVGDVDENGKPDLIATNWQEAGATDSVVIFRNNGSRTFTRSVLVPRYGTFNGDFTALRLLDINGDGHLDIVADALNSGSILTFIGNGDGTFLSPTSLDGDNIDSIAVGPIGNPASMGAAVGLYQTFMAAKYSCATQVHAFTVSPVVSVGQAAPLRALVSGIGPNTVVPRGTVTFYDGATSIGTADVDTTGEASLDYTGLSVGTHTISAQFGGNATLSAATSNSFSEKVTTATSTTTLVLSSTSITYGTDLTVQVGISSTTAGSFNAYYNLTVDGVTTKYWNASAVTLKLGTGIHSLTAAYLGDDVQPPSTSPTKQVTVAKATPAVTSPSASALTVRSGFAFVLPFTVQGPAGYAGPTGSLTMTERGGVIATSPLSSGSATLSVTLQRGSHDVIVSYSGDGNFNTTSVALTLVVLQNVTLAIEARGLQNAISIRAVLPAGTTFVALSRSPSGANTWSGVGGWTPDVELDTTVPSRGVLYDYRVTVIASGVQQTSNIDSAMLFTDDPVSSSVAVKRIHFDELRLAINAQRAVAGLAPFNFDATYSGTFIRASHLASMRTALTEARQALGMALPVYTDSATVSTPIRAIHIQELRDQAR